MPPSSDSAAPNAERTLRGVVLAVLAGQLLVPFMHSGVAVMLPSIGRDLHASAAQLGLIGAVYCLSLAIFHLLMGRAGDKWGRRRLCVCGTTLLTVTVGLTFFCPSIHLLIGLRFLQGMGTATINTCALAMLVACSPPERLGKLIGLTMTGIFLGLAIGPVVGGLVDTWFGWRWLFGGLALLGAGALLIMLTCVREEWYESPEKPFDWLGAGIFALSMAAFALGAAGPLSPGAAGVCIALGLAGFVLFGRQQAVSAMPLLDVRTLMTNRVFVLSNLASCIMYSALFAVTFFFSLYLQYVKGYSPRDAGLLLSVEPLVQLAFTALGGMAADRFGAARVSLYGTGIAAVCLGAGCLLDADSSVWAVGAVLALNGLSIAIFSTPNTVVIMNSVDPAHMSQASGLVGTGRTMGMLCSMILATCFMRLHVGGEALSAATVPGFLTAMHQSFLLFGVLCLLGIACSVGRMK